MSRLFDVDASGDISTDVLSVSSSPLSAYGFSCFAWYKPSTLTTGFDARCISGLANSGIGTQFVALGVDADGFPHVVARNTTYLTAASSALVAAGEWNAIGAVWGSATNRLIYHARLNDTALNTGGGTVTSVTLPALNRLTIGLLGDSTPNQGAGGLIATTVWWNVALSVADWELLMLGRVSPRAVRPQNLVFCAQRLGYGATEVDIIGRRVLSVTGTTASADEPPAMWLPGRKRIYLAFSSDESTATSAGTSTANAVANSIASAAASASGSSAVSAVGASIAASASSSAGVASATAVGRSTAATTATASGVGAATASSSAAGEAVASSQGNATVSGVGALIASAMGTTSGAAAVTATGVALFLIQGAASGSAQTVAVAASTSAAIGAASGATTAAGVSDVPINPPPARTYTVRGQTRVVRIAAGNRTIRAA